MDPIEIEDEHILNIQNTTVSLIQEIDPACSIHDFRVVDGKHQINLIFDLVVPRDYAKEKQNEVETVSLIQEIDPACSIHDFRVVDGKHQINLIFDLVVPRDYAKEKQNEVERLLCEKLKEQDTRYEFVITVEHNFVSSN